MTIPSYEELMPLVLQYATQERRVRDATTYISDKLGLDEQERIVRLSSNTDTVINSRVAWAITYLVQAGLLRRPRRAHFIITDRGLEVLKQDVSQLNTEYLKRFPEFRDFRERQGRRASNKFIPSQFSTVTHEQEQNYTPEERISRALDEIEIDLKEQLLSRILENGPVFFETLVIKLLSAMGYGGNGNLSLVTGKVGDGGIDGLIYQDKLGLDVVYIQAKRYKLENKVQRPELQAFVGTLAGVSAHKGVFVTTSDFSPGALQYLQTVNSRVVTIDGNRLVELMIENEIGVRVKQEIKIRRLDEDFFLDE